MYVLIKFQKGEFYYVIQNEYTDVIKNEYTYANMMEYVCIIYISTPIIYMCIYIYYIILVLDIFICKGIHMYRYVYTYYISNYIYIYVYISGDHTH